MTKNLVAVIACLIGVVVGYLFGDAISTGDVLFLVGFVVTFPVGFKLADFIKERWLNNGF